MPALAVELTGLRQNDRVLQRTAAISRPEEPRRDGIGPVHLDDAVVQQIHAVAQIVPEGRFLGQGEVVLDNPLHIILIAVPLIIQTFFIFFLAFGVCRIIRLPYDIAAPAGMIGASNFFELAVAVAVALFGTSSPAALATTVGVLTEVPVMLTLVKIANKLKEKFKYE